jgi:hypothetical protein
MSRCAGHGRDIRGTPINARKLGTTRGHVPLSVPPMSCDIFVTVPLMSRKPQVVSCAS